MWTHRPLQTFLKIFHREKDNWWALTSTICFYIDSNTIWSLKLKTTSNTSLLIFIMQVLGAYEDVFMSHSSWFVYQATMRIYKHYNFNVSDPATSSKRTSFSSYPGKSCICFDLHYNLILYVMCQWICKKHQINLIIIRIIILLSFPND